MTLQFAIEVLVYGGVIPAAIAIAVVFLANILLAENVAQRWAMAAGFSIAFVIGYVLLPDWAPLLPQRNWHWFPQLAATAMVIGPVGIARGISTAERWLLWLLLAVIAACLLVPTWPALMPSRHKYVAFLAVYFLVVTALADPLSCRFSPRLVMAQLCLSVTIAAPLVVMIVIKYGQIAVIAAAAAIGCCIATCVYASSSMVRGLIPALTVVTAGLAFIACLEPQKPLAGMLLLPVAPLALWFSALGPLAKLRGTAAVAVQTLLVVAVLVAGGIMAWTGL